MCRLVAYLGRPILMEKLLIEPKNSLINQSFNAKEIEEPLNGDGFGVGWYNHILSPTPATFKSITPAWNNQNLKSFAPLVKSTCFMAHVRAATVGVLGEVNCHPFQYKTILMMHNGDAPEFPKLKRVIRRELSDELYNWIHGETDSEHLFALFIDKLNQRIEHETTTAEVMADALEDMVRQLEEIKKACGVTDQAYLNMEVSDGERTVAMRYISKPEEEKPLSLYYSEGSRYECIDGACHMIPAEDENKSVMVVSEKLTDIATDWKQVPVNHMVLVYKDLSIQLRKIAL